MELYDILLLVAFIITAIANTVTLIVILRRDRREKARKEQMRNEVIFPYTPLCEWVYSLHSKDVATCDRCHRSTRNPCIQCGHTLSGRIHKIAGEPYTTCEVCGLSQNYVGEYV